MKKFIVIIVLFMCFGIQAQEQTETPQYTGKIYTSEQVDKVAEYPRGIQAFFIYLQKNFRIPDVQEDTHVKFNFEFLIETDGTISEVVIATEVSKELEEQVVKLVKNCPEKWKPAIKNNVAVRSTAGSKIEFSVRKE